MAHVTYHLCSTRQRTLTSPCSGGWSAESLCQMHHPIWPLSPSVVHHDQFSTTALNFSLHWLGRLSVASTDGFIYGWHCLSWVWTRSYWDKGISVGHHIKQCQKGRMSGHFHIHAESLLQWGKIPTLVYIQNVLVKFYCAMTNMPP